jgi:hypothetical protein
VRSARRSANLPPRVQITFREAIDRFLANCTPAGQDGPIFDADQAHLDRWAKDSRGEAVWRKVQKFAPPNVEKLDVLDTFILTVLLARRAAESVGAPKRLVQRHRESAAISLKRARQLEALARVWRDLAKAGHAKAREALVRAKTHEEEARGWRRAAERAAPKRRWSLSRVDRSGSRKHRFFMQSIGEQISKLCRRPLDGEIAILNDIAFDTSEATTVFQARSARRPTTSKGRSKTVKIT